jgi:hypothetical protein
MLVYQRVLSQSPTGLQGVGPSHSQPRHGGLVASRPRQPPGNHPVATTPCRSRDFDQSRSARYQEGATMRQTPFMGVYVYKYIIYYMCNIYIYICVSNIMISLLLLWLFLLLLFIMIIDILVYSHYIIIRAKLSKLKGFNRIIPYHTRFPKTPLRGWATHPRGQTEAEHCQWPSCGIAWTVGSLDRSWLLWCCPPHVMLGKIV